MMRKAVVIGSGPGGAAAARELSRDHEVRVLEAGEKFVPMQWNLAR